MTVDTIFICYCIDVEENDGVENPYYMSDSLRKIMMELKGFAGAHMNIEMKGDAEVGPGMADGSSIPMLPQQPMPPVYPQIGGQEGQNLNYYGPPPYPGQQVYQQQPEGYQGQPMPYPGQQMSYPGQQPPYPGQNMPYPQDTWETEQSEKQQNHYHQQQSYPSTSYPPINYNQQ